MRLWLIRHAKSSWANAKLRDFDRPLNDRGERDGPAMQAWLARQSFGPELIRTSDAARARATAAFVHAAFPAAELLADHRLYGAPPEMMADIVRETPPEIESLALVAHNPGLTQWCNLLAGRRQTIDNLPTFGAALLQWDGGPDALAPSAASLEILSSPKTLPPTFSPARQPLP